MAANDPDEIGVRHAKYVCALGGGGARYTIPNDVDEIEQLPDDGWRYELVEGKVVRMPGTGLEHLEVTDNLHAALRAFVKAHQLGLVTLPDTAFKLSDDTSLLPDIGFIGTAKVQTLPAWGRPARRKTIPVAPDLAVEIASPDQYRPEMAEKAAIYLRHGALLVWINWPTARQVDVWHPGAAQPVSLPETGVLSGESVALGFSHAVADLFQPFAI